MADDRRDDELAALLEVEPLDDLTRRRLVHRAAAAADEQAAPAHRERSLVGRFVAMAAVLLVLAIGVVGLLQLPRDDTEEVAGKSSAAADSITSEAQRAPTAAPGSEQDSARRASEATSGGAAADASAAVTALGDVGDLSTRAARTNLLETLDAMTLGRGPAGEALIASVPCPLNGLASMIALGTATVDGRPAAVVVTERADGTRRVRLVIGDPCEVRQLR